MRSDAHSARGTRPFAVWCYNTVGLLRQLFGDRVACSDPAKYLSGNPTSQELAALSRWASMSAE
jgi:hypothetical protein